MTGIDKAKLDLLLQLSAVDVEAGRLPSAQVAVAFDGQLVAAETFGAAKPATRYVLQSAGRPVVASAIWMLLSRGAIDLGRTVASYIPEFGSNGKQDVTVEQVLTHVAGFPLAPLGYPKMLSRAARLEAFANWRLTYEPGTRLEFHLTSAAWVIAELVERIDGRPLPVFLRQEVYAPLALTSMDLEVPIERQADVAVAQVTGEPTDEVFPWGPWFTVQPEVLAAGEPSHSMVSTAADLAMFYQGVHRRSDLWSPEVIADATRVRVNLPIEGERGGAASIPAGVALFVQVAGTDGLSRGFLPTTGSPSLWGNGGAPCQVGFLDPETGLSFAWLTNGYPPSGYEQTRAGKNRISHIANLAADLIG
jgi:CubicO group peptidase (beta-lactamase class C family)